MRDLAIRADGLSKQYVIHGGWGYRPDTLRDYLAQSVKNALMGNGRPGHTKEAIWAVRDVSFEVRRGEAVGVIGRNGAGKSTLLKILARITEPTAGTAEIRGRVGSLLEVGTGFNTELTGRENVYLNGAILGMKKAEIDSQYDDIVAFSGVEQFIDTPVKRYSSGMYLRLAFAVAAHLRPEILLIDEVLAVGDVEFQQKCLGKMGDVTREGRTVLFVSHNLGAIAQLCKRALWIDGGRLKLDGPATDVVTAYLSSFPAAGARRLDAAAGDHDAGKFRFTSVRILSSENGATAVVEFRSPFRIEIGYELRTSVRDLSVVCRLTDAKGNVVWTSWDSDSTERKNGDIREAGHYRSTCHIPPYLLRPGTYHVLIGAHTRRERFPTHENALTFEVSAAGFHLNRDRVGILTPVLPWEVRRVDGASDEEPVGGPVHLGAHHISSG